MSEYWLYRESEVRVGLRLPPPRRERDLPRPGPSPLPLRIRVRRPSQPGSFGLLRPPSSLKHDQHGCPSSPPSVRPLLTSPSVPGLSSTWPLFPACLACHSGRGAMHGAAVSHSDNVVQRFKAACERLDEVVVERDTNHCSGVDYLSTPLIPNKALHTEVWLIFTCLSICMSLHRRRTVWASNSFETRYSISCCSEQTVQTSGGSKRTCVPSAPLLGPFCFIFMPFSAKSLPNNR